MNCSHQVFKNGLGLPSVPIEIPTVLEGGVIYVKERVGEHNIMHSKSFVNPGHLVVPVKPDLTISTVSQVVKRQRAGERPFRC